MIGAREPAELHADAGLDSPGLVGLARLMRRVRRLDRRHPWLLDTVLVLALIGLTLLNLRRNHEGDPFARVAAAAGDVPVFVPFVLGGLLIGALWFRRRYPAGTFFFVAVVAFAQSTMGMWQPAGLSALIALCTLASRGRLRALAWAAGLIVVEAVVIIWFLIDVDDPLLSLFFLLSAGAAAIGLGLNLRIRRLYVAALRDRAHRLKVERDQIERLIASSERSRVAREMHDILGHNLSVMVPLADGAATLAEQRGEESAPALRMLADTGRQAMDELRRVLGVLRESDGDELPLRPQPGIEDLDALVARVRVAGLAVDLVRGGDLVSLGGGVQLTVYRIVQEALTNTLKHAGSASSAEVEVSTASGWVLVRVADTGPGSSSSAASAVDKAAGADGHGLVGIRQRAAMYGSTVKIGPRLDAPGWIVDVMLDVRSTPAVPGGTE